MEYIKEQEKEKQQEKKYREKMNRILEYKNNNSSLEEIEEEILTLIRELTYSEEYNPYGRKYIPVAYKIYGEYLSSIDRHHDAFKAYQCALDAYQNNSFWNPIRTYLFERLYANLYTEAAKSEHYTEAFYYFDNYKQIISDYVDKAKQEQRANPRLRLRGSLLEEKEMRLFLLDMYPDSVLKTIIGEKSLTEKEKNNYEIFICILGRIKKLEDTEEKIKTINKLRVKINEEIKKDKTPFMTQYQTLLKFLDDKCDSMLLRLRFEKMSGRKIDEVPDTEDGGSWNITSEREIPLKKIR